METSLGERKPLLLVQSLQPFHHGHCLRGSTHPGGKLADLYHMVPSVCLGVELLLCLESCPGAVGGDARIDPMKEILFSSSYEKTNHWQ